MVYVLIECFEFFLMKSKLDGDLNGVYRWLCDGKEVLFEML